MTAIPVTAPCGAVAQAAARALRMVTATRITCGKAQITARVILFLHWFRAVGFLQVLVAMAGVLLPRHLLCAVSWIWIFK